MSYNWYLVPASDAADIGSKVRDYVRREEYEAVLPPEPGKEAWKAKLRNALLRVDPELEPFSYDYGFIAERLGVSEAQARANWRRIELSTLADGPGIEVTLDDDMASICVPFSHVGYQARRVFAKVRRYAALLCSEGGLVVYDPQLERPVDLDADMTQVLRRYGEAALRMTGASQPRAASPWWKLW